MRTLNKILQLVVTIIFLLFIGAGVLVVVIGVLEIRPLGAGGIASMLGMSVVTFVLFFIGMLFAFGLFSTLLEIAENTRVLRDAVQSGSLKVTVVRNQEKPIESRLTKNDLTLEDGLNPLKEFERSPKPRAKNKEKTNTE